ncbi:MAG: hypothetical protein GY822_27495 [Deltaproteobacteria bacterium]|nr:hypothetical protein [Deltaproteobacteria bacterium]
MSKTEKELQTELAEIKGKHAGIPIFKLETFINEDDEQKRTIFLRKPTRLVRSAGEKVAATDAWKGVETFLRGMYLGGDDIDEIVKNDDALMIAGECVMDIIKLKPGNVQKV